MIFLGVIAFALLVLFIINIVPEEWVIFASLVVFVVILGVMITFAGFDDMGWLGWFMFGAGALGLFNLVRGSNG